MQTEPLPPPAYRGSQWNGLNAGVSPKFMLTPSPGCDGIWRWGGGIRSGGWSLMNAIGALIEETPESASPLLPCEDRARRWPCRHQEAGLSHTQSLRVPVSGTVRDTCVANWPPARGTLSQRSELRHQAGPQPSSLRKHLLCASTVPVTRDAAPFSWEFGGFTKRSSSLVNGWKDGQRSPEGLCREEGPCPSEKPGNSRGRERNEA